MRTIAVIALIGLLVFSCRKEENNLTSLTGKWYWLSSSGGLTGMTQTPESSGDEQISEFAKDSIFRFFRNDTLVIEGKYHLKSNFGESGTLLFYYNNNSIEESFLIKHQDTLILKIDQCFDCPISTFKRIKQ